MEPDIEFADAGVAADAVHEHCHGTGHWFAGTASNPRDPLAALHNLDLKHGNYFYVRCMNAGVARAAVLLLRLERGYRTAPSPAGADCVFLYAYTITDEARGRSSAVDGGRPMSRFKVRVLGTDEEITDNPPAIVLTRREYRGLEARHDIKTSNLLSAVDLRKVVAAQTTLVLYVSRPDGWRPAWVSLVDGG